MSEEYYFVFEDKKHFLGNTCNDSDNKNECRTNAIELMHRYQTYYKHEAEECEYALRGAVLYCTHRNRYIHLDSYEDHGIYSKGDVIH